MRFGERRSRQQLRDRRDNLHADGSGLTDKCKADPGVFIPIVNAMRCEGKGDCAVVCPYNVFEIGRMPDERFASMPTLVKFKLWAHGRKTAFTPNADACKACGACVKACPEKAITLARR
jgi:NAD-dependent dihydropyrimidine dehydrogenase PreA subunit